MQFLNSFELSPLSWLLFFICGILVGMSKMGVAGMGLAVVPLLAHVFGGKLSTGVLLPVLVIADIIAVKYYNRHAEWKHLWKLLPWAIAGIFLGLYVGDNISDVQFKKILAVIIIITIILMVWQTSKGKSMKVPDYWWLAGLAGLAGGFATMVGNAAGPLMAIYLLAMNMPKNEFIGTRAWFFLIINLFKVPLHVIFWKTITPDTFILDLVLIPAVVIGAFLGVYVVKKIPEKAYRLFVIIVTTISALALIF
ncbi:sulfite exporter TauE/SafE family protein [Chondrinema litorale]|uniref:sulfite exporter TauE/SafE family protein n=1 Tax=Chondrinema litorale TaxID=2994555 RepID=UPI00254326D1|nr:sulfite exporter TauE/SafE family protein [Chondrinema litorale]UZR95658.1 sulfite exporter TauE/SafE family protein [Chondrinema litorale]